MTDDEPGPSLPSARRCGAVRQTPRGPERCEREAEARVLYASDFGPVEIRYCAVHLALVAPPQGYQVIAR